MTPCPLPLHLGQIHFRFEDTRAMPIPLRCRCHQVQGELGTARTYVRATCYCKSCQAYAHWLGTPGLTDAAGGSDVVAMSPSQVRFTAGQEQIACMSLSDRGILRWYAACCRTPLGNTPRTPDVHYVGIHTACLEGAGDAVDAAFGPAGRCVINTDSATAPVRATPLAFAFGGLRIAMGILGARLRKLRASPFFDDAGRPIRSPEVPATR
jgi:hypothetical protein